MAQRKHNTAAPTISAASAGYKARLWPMADALRGSMDGADSKRVVLGSSVLKYVSDAFEEQHRKLTGEGIRELKADFIRAHLPCNLSDRRLPAPSVARQAGGDRLHDDEQWQYDVPPADNASTS